MAETEPSHELKALLKESVSADEVRMLVERLTEGEFSEPVGSTLGDVVEAIQVDPIIAAKMLNEWRQEALEDRIAQVTGDHGVRIERLEDSTEALRLIAGVDGRALDKSDLDGVRRIVEERKQAESFTPWAIVVFIVAVLAMLMIVSYGQQQNSLNDAAQNSVSTIVNGVEISLDGAGNYLATEPNGTTRAPTNEEMQAARMTLIFVQRSRQNDTRKSRSQ